MTYNFRCGLLHRCTHPYYDLESLESIKWLLLKGVVQEKFCATPSSSAKLEASERRKKKQSQISKSMATPITPSTPSNKSNQ